MSQEDKRVFPSTFLHAHSPPDQKKKMLQSSFVTSQITSSCSRGAQMRASLFVMPREMHCDLHRMCEASPPVPFRSTTSGAGRVHAHASEKHLLSQLWGAAHGPDGGIKHAWVARSSENNYTHLLETERVHPTKSPPIIETSSQHTNEDTSQWLTTTERETEPARECVCVRLKEEKCVTEMSNRPCTG